MNISDLFAIRIRNYFRPSLSFLIIGITFSNYIMMWLPWGFSPFMAGLGALGVAGSLALPIHMLWLKKERLARNEIVQIRKRFDVVASNAGVWEFHADNYYQWCSREYFHMLGYAESDFTRDGKLDYREIWINLLHPDDRERAVRHFEWYLSINHTSKYENQFRMKHSNEKWVWILSRGQTLFNEDGMPGAITIGTHTDISEKMNLEIALRKHNEKLLRYAFMNAHHLRGPVARVLGLIYLVKLDPTIDHCMIFEKIENESNEIDHVLRVIMKELNEIEDHEF